MVINLTKSLRITIMWAGKKRKIHRMIYDPANETTHPQKNITITKNTRKNQFHINTSLSRTFSWFLAWPGRLASNGVNP